MGIVSSIGKNQDEVLESLREGRSGISFSEDYAERGFRSQVHGMPDGRYRRKPVDKKLHALPWATARRGTTSPWIRRSPTRDCADDEVSNERTGIIMGSGGPSTKTIVRADTTRDKGPKRVGPFAVPAAMSSTNSATLAVPFGIKGVNYSISSACSTSAHCIGNAAELIQWGKQDIMFAGGGEELDWTLSVLFDAMGAMSPTSTTRRKAPLAPMTRTATASSLPAAAARWCSKSLNTPRRAARRSTAKWSVMAPPRTATTWCSPPARARCAACVRRCRR
jgi:3-oxoacyl-[acyl-carrier-protein] synthase-1